MGPVSLSNELMYTEQHRTYTHQMLTSLPSPIFPSVTPTVFKNGLPLNLRIVYKWVNALFPNSQLSFYRKWPILSLLISTVTSNMYQVSNDIFRLVPTFSVLVLQSLCLFLCFITTALWNISRVDRAGLLRSPLWTFLGRFLAFYFPDAH